MNCRSRSSPCHVLLLLSAALLAVLIAVTATGLWHTHSSAAEAAACGVCHVGSTPAVHPAINHLTPPAPMVEENLVLAVASEGAAPIFSSKSPRAPPRAA
jgi:hypothetical protein